MAQIFSPHSTFTHSPQPGWQHALLGPRGPTRQAVRRQLWLLPTYAVVTVLLLLGALLERIPPAPALVLIGYICCGQLIFYTLLRSGWAAKRQETALAYPQVLFNIGAMLLAYASMPSSRCFSLQWLCLALTFDMHRLTRKQVNSATLMSIMGLGCIVGSNLLSHPDQLNVIGELINIGMASITLPVLVMVAGLARKLRKQGEQQKADLSEALQEMRCLSVRDGLTRCYTRRHMQQKLAEEAARQRRSRRVFCVAMLDIDFFKRANDRHGHAVGDTVLIEFARLVQGAMHGSHTLARWGGEEFLLLMPETNLLQALDTMARIRAAIHAHDWSQHACGLNITFSGGVCQHLITDQLEHIIDRADQALYAAKAQGRDGVVAAESLVAP